MDDKGLLNKPQDDKPTDNDQKKIDEALNQLPDTSPSSKPLGQTPPEPAKATPPPSKPTPLPPPSIPSMPPVAAAGTPPPTTPPSDDKPIPTEEVKIEKPKRRLGKNAKKIVGGVLVLALLVGGVVVGRNVVKERQVVESEAATACQFREKDECDGCMDETYKCVWNRNLQKCQKRRDTDKCTDGDDGSDGDWCSDWDWTWPEIDNSCSIYYCPGIFYCSTCNTGKGDLSKAKVKSGDFCGVVQIDCDEGYMEIWSNVGCHATPTPTPTPSPTPSPSPTPTPTPSPTPSPGPEFSCVDLSSDTDPIEYGDLITFTCEGAFSSATAPVAYFRYSVDSGAYTVLPSAYAIDLISNTASTDITVDEYGEWNVQCRVCEDDTATASCTAWGEAS